MKLLSRVLPLVLLVTAADLSGAISLLIAQLKLLELAPVVAQTTSIQISLPELATIALKSGGSRSGRVMGLDVQNQELRLQRGSESAAIPLSQIAKVIYDRQAQFYREAGPPVLRGGEQAAATGPQATWSDVPLSAFRLNDASRGQAEVMLDSVMSGSTLRGIRAVASSSTYVADEMQFNLQQGTMTISVTPY